MTVTTERQQLTDVGSSRGTGWPRETLRANVADAYTIHETGYCDAAWWCERHDNFADDEGHTSLVEHTRRIAEMSIDHDKKIVEVVVTWPEMLGDTATRMHPHTAIWTYEHGNRDVISLSAHLTGAPNWIAGELADVLNLLGEGRWLADALHAAHDLLCRINFQRRQDETSANK